MSKISDGGFAFPRPVGDNMADHPADRLWNHAQTGMSLRDWFAGQALDAIIRAVCAVSVAALMLAGCAQNVGNRYTYEPVVDVAASGKTHDEYLVDLDACQQLAAQRDGTGEAVAGAIAGALLGAALGGIVGHAYGAPQHGMAYGAGMGGITAGAKGAAAGHGNQQSIVQNCLAGRGYRVVGR